jgi:hypothetical protein
MPVTGRAAAASLDPPAMPAATGRFFSKRKAAPTFVSL